VKEKEDFNKKVFEKIGLIQQGNTIDELTKRIKATQNTNLLDSSLHQVLTIPANNETFLVDRMTRQNPERMQDNFFFQVHNINFQRFSSPEFKDLFTNIDVSIKNSYMAEDNSFWIGIVNILAGNAGSGQQGLVQRVLTGLFGVVLNRKNEIEGGH
jgi:hypothetical protein